MKQLAALLTLFTLLCSFNARANHLSGGELRYEYNGTNYTFYLTMYSDCGSSGMPSSINMTMKSTALGINSQLALVPTTTSTTALKCGSISTKCDAPAGNFPGYRKHVFSTTTTLAAAADWVFYIDPCCRNFANNLSTAGSMYLGTTLNNTIGVNSNAYVPTFHPGFLGINTTTTSPLQYIDADGDSVVIQVSPALVSTGAPSGYSFGYSATQPHGSTGIYNVNGVNGTITQRASMFGNTVLAFTVSEYRNGNLISSYNREFVSTSISLNTNYSYTYPQAPIQVAYACPGAAGTATASFLDSVSTDSVFVSVDTPALAGWNFTVTNTNGVGAGSTTINWTAPASLNPTTLPYFYLKIKTWDNACPRGYNEYAILVKTQSVCVADSVWPGDANSDKIANLLDVLAVAVAYGQTGPTRAGATTAWVGQYVADWANNYPFTTTNVKHGDCNGDGVINVADLGAIATNYGLTHAKGSLNKSTGIADLYFDMTDVVPSPGSTVNIPIKLGNLSSSVAGLYGVAATINTNGLSLTTPLQITTNGSWLGNTTNTIEFNKAFGNETQAWAFARNNHAGISGYGTIAWLSFTIPANTPVGREFTINFDDATLIDKDGQPIGFNPVNTTFKVVPVGVASVQNVLKQAVVIPNPSHNQAQVMVQLTQSSDVNIRIADMAGKTVYEGSEKAVSNNQYITLPATLTSGIYTIQVSVDGGTAPQTLKWVKQ